MIQQDVLARLHLSAVLQNIEEVVDFDPEAKEIVKDWHHVMQFSCPGGIGAHIEFGQGRARVFRGSTSWPNVALWFPTATMLNNTFMGKGFSLPIPWAGGWKIDLLKGFTELSKRLEFYLKPSKETLKKRENFEFHVRGLLYTSVFGLKAVGEGDRKVRKYIEACRDGVVEFRILGGPSAHVMVKKGKIFPYKGPAEEPNAIMELRDYDVAFGLFTGTMDPMALVGKSALRIAGYIPLVDNLNAALDRLAHYLN